MIVDKKSVLIKDFSENWFCMIGIDIIVYMKWFSRNDCGWKEYALNSCYINWLYMSCAEMLSYKKILLFKWFYNYKILSQKWLCIRQDVCQNDCAQLFIKKDCYRNVCAWNRIISKMIVYKREYMSKWLHNCS